MEALTKKTVTVEFEGKKFALQEDATVEDLLIQLGLPRDMQVRFQVTPDGFVLVP